MKKALNVTCKIVLSLLMVMPILGTLGIFPAPTAEMYSNPNAFAFIEALMNSGYINPLMAIAFAFALFCLWTKRTALAALLILPLTVNIVAFHAFLDGGLFTPGSVMADVLLLLNGYFLYEHRNTYRTLFAKEK